MSHGYVWFIAFTGAGGEPYSNHVRIENAYQHRADAVKAAQAEDGHGTSYGAFPKRRRVTLEEKAKARQAWT